MSYSISVSGHGPVDDDLRAAFGELIRTLRAVTPEAADGGSGPGGSLYTGTASYAAADIPDEEPVDDEPTDEEDTAP